jgi:hypothetical protein
MEEAVSIKQALERTFCSLGSLGYSQVKKEEEAILHFVTGNDVFMACFHGLTEGKSFIYGCLPRISCSRPETIGIRYLLLLMVEIFFVSFQ